MQILLITLLGAEPGKEPCALEHKATNSVWGVCGAVTWHLVSE